MNKLLPSRVAALCVALAMVLSAGAAWAERRVALVIGNSQYKNASLALTNPKNDAEDVAAMLRTLGFEVIQTTDASKRDFDLAMTKFARLGIDADSALFYYAGHALQYQGQNYLMPTDVELEDEFSLRYQTVSLDDIRASLEQAHGAKIMILDACRNNPLVDRLGRRMTGVTRNIGAVRGLARIDKGQGMMVVYATAADEVAKDGSGRNSPFTAALLKRLGDAGLEIATMFRRVAADVVEQTNGQQRPELLISLISEYYLNQNDRPVWDRIKDTADQTAFRDFINRFPSSPRASDARYRLQMLEREQSARVSQNRNDKQPAKAAADQQKQQLTLAPPASLPINLQPPTVTQEQVCKRDEERLARLRASQARDEVIRFERELGCERLRPQLLRLRESIIPAQGEQDWREDAQRLQVEQPRPTADDGSQGRKRDASLQAAPSSIPQEQLCKRDQERLSRLRATPAPDEVIRLARELGCERLRPQVLRLQESLGAN